MRNLVLSIFLLTIMTSNAQFGKNCEVQQLKINLVHPGLEYERGIGVNQTIDIRASWQLALDPFSIEPIENFDFFPALVIQTRFYHNLDRRFRNGRKAYGNSGNYIAPTVAAFSPETRIVDDIRVGGVYTYAGAVYGIQRSFNSGLSLSIDAGAAYYLGAFKGGIYPVFNFSIGWIVSEKRWCVGK